MRTSCQTSGSTPARPSTSAPPVRDRRGRRQRAPGYRSWGRDRRRGSPPDPAGGRRGARVRRGQRAQPADLRRHRPWRQDHAGGDASRAGGGARGRRLCARDGQAGCGHYQHRTGRRQRRPRPLRGGIRLLPRADDHRPGRHPVPGQGARLPARGRAAGGDAGCRGTAGGERAPRAPDRTGAEHGDRGHPHRAPAARLRRDSHRPAVRPRWNARRSRRGRPRTAGRAWRCRRPCRRSRRRHGGRHGCWRAPRGR